MRSGRPEADQDNTEGTTHVAVKMRLMRMGKTKQPTYRVVVTDSRSARDGRFIEIVGTYEPRLNPSGITINDERALHWLRIGAQPTETVQKLLTINGTWGTFRSERPEKPTKPRNRPGRVRARAKAAKK